MEVPEFFVGGYFGADNQFVDQKLNENNTNVNQFAIDDLLDFSKHDEEVMTDGYFDNLAGNSTYSSTVTVLDSSNSSISGREAPISGNISCRSFGKEQFSGSELCVPYDDLAELEWLSNFVDEDSFSTNNLQNLHLISSTTQSPTATTTSLSSSTNTTPTTFNHEPPVTVPSKARSKRSRTPPCDWSSRLLLLSTSTSSSHENDLNTHKTTMSKKRENADTSGRKCLHCASEKTPQWRTGPMGPKTLCNACGVRYKSGRLVPEYRPAASPTFVSAEHSNSHRKVIELRRQKEIHRHFNHQHQQQLIGQPSILGMNGEDYLMMKHHHIQSGGQDFRHVM